MTTETPPEEMARFFDARADGYDEHMRGVVRSFEAFYEGIAAPLPATGEPLRVLDLGCGTGLELPGIWARAPGARITGIDLSGGMLARLRDRFAGRAAQLELVEGSYLEHPLGEGAFDCAVSAMTLHHLVPQEKAALYARLRAALRPGGIYVEGDYVVSPADEARFLAEYRAARAAEGSAAPQRHIDIPASLATQERLFGEAGFTGFRLCWQEGEAAIYTVRAPG